MNNNKERTKDKRGIRLRQRSRQKMGTRLLLLASGAALSLFVIGGLLIYFNFSQPAKFPVASTRDWEFFCLELPVPRQGFPSANRRPRESRWLTRTRRGVWYTRADEYSCEEIVPCGRDGAYLSRFFCANAENERAERHAHQSAIPLQQYSEKNFEGLSPGISGNRIRSIGTYFPRQAF